MRTRYFFWLSAFLIIGMFLLAFTSWQSSAANGGLQLQSTASPAADSVKKGVILDLPDGASQAEIGKEVYRLVCSACHAYDGSGLTAEWRATWDPADQNCWQSKCHGDNHPEDGFYLPYSPPIVGAFFPRLFPTALDLYTYLDATMPWHDPGVLPEDQLWAVTAHVLRLNGYEPGEALNAQNAAGFRLTPNEASPPARAAAQSAVPTQTHPPDMPPSPRPFQSPPVFLYGFILFGVISGLAWLFFHNQKM